MKPEKKKKVFFGSRPHHYPKLYNKCMQAFVVNCGKPSSDAIRRFKREIINEDET